jgi:hypothetical protein
LLYLAGEGQSVGPEAKIVVPLREWEGLECGSILLLYLPVLEGEGEFLFIESEHNIIEFIVLALEVIFVL